MIDIYTGTPGSGKSLHMAKDIRDMLCRGGLVISNFEISRDFLESKRCRGRAVHLSDKELFYPSDTAALISYWVKNRSTKILLCLDECQGLFNARTWNMAGRSEWVDFFALHRHLSEERCRVILATQDDASVDKQIRHKVECEYKHYKIKNGSNAYFIFSMLFFGGNLFKYRWFWYGQKQHLGSSLFIGRKKLFKIYDTHASFGGGPASGSAAMMKRAAELLGEGGKEEAASGNK